jgi:hypothetical protein
LDYALAHEAMAVGTVAVREVSEQGQVPFLLVDNGGDQPVLFIEGAEVRGGKQNRVLRTSILAPGRSQTRIPVVCTQLHRWEYDTRHFASGSHCPPSLRHILKGGSPGERPDQSRIWAAIRQKHRRLGVRSQSENMSDVLETHREKVDELRVNLPYVEGASGIAVAIGGEVVSVDIFDKPATCRKVWERWVEGLILDVAGTECHASGTEVSVRLYATREMRWQQVDPIGLGEKYRAHDDGNIATALVVDSTLLHLSVSMPVVH